jgi:hypothetical protein
MTRLDDGALSRGSQLELFLPAPICMEHVELTDAEALQDALIKGLGEGRAVGVLRMGSAGEPRFQLRLTVLGEESSRDPWWAGPAQGYSRRAEELLIHSVRPWGPGYWARPAGKRWQGWAEWGTFPRPT